MITLKKELSGKILDIGGGGEGIIGRLYREQVTAIDNRQEELEESPEGYEKVLMDATNLQYADSSFDHVTSFFTLMFMCAEEQRRTIKEAARVLRSGGQSISGIAILHQHIRNRFVLMFRFCCRLSAFLRPMAWASSIHRIEIL